MEKKFPIKNKLGLHLRPAALLVTCANKYPVQVTVKKEGGEEVANGRSIMGLTALCAAQGSVLIINAGGERVEEFFNELEDLIIRRTFDEE